MAGEEERVGSVNFNFLLVVRGYIINEEVEAVLPRPEQKDMTVKGVIKGRTIELMEDIPIQDGATVDVSIGIPNGRPPLGSAARILQTLKDAPQVDRDAVDELERLIRDSKRPVSAKGVFDDE